jgi:glyoxylase-like metal-dependent hydrolase (beta-lactamase superfamily II)
MKIIPLSEGKFTVDQTKRFIPFDASVNTLQDRAAGSLLVEIQPFVVVTQKDVILLDAGLGYRLNGELQLHYNLRQAGIDPGQVTKVVFSHLHKDHMGGAVIADESGLLTSAFPHATYFIQRAEMDFALSKQSSSFIAPVLEWLSSCAQVRWLEGTGVIDDYIQYEISGGHSPCHQSVKIVEQGVVVFYGGDEAPQLQQMKHRFVAKYDYDGKKAMELRNRWKEQGTKENWTFLFYHDVQHPTHQF